MEWFHSPIEKLSRLKDVLSGNRADGRIPAWSDDDSAHVYVDPDAHTHTESQVTDLGAYPDATGVGVAQMAETDGEGTWRFVNSTVITRTRGTATIEDPNTSVDVDHGLDRNPHRGEVQVTPASSLATASEFWISDRNASTFRINVDVSPGAGTPAEFDWLFVAASALLIDGGTASTTTFDDSLDGGTPSTSTWDESVDGGAPGTEF